MLSLEECVKLKELGADQTLDIGDWYYDDEDEPVGTILNIGMEGLAFDHYIHIPQTGELIAWVRELRPEYHLGIAFDPRQNKYHVWSTGTGTFDNIEVYADTPDDALFELIVAILKK